MMDGCEPYNDVPDNDRLAQLGDLRQRVGKCRPFTADLKSWLFYDAAAGANAEADLYSLIETRKTNTVEPYSYRLLRKWRFTRDSFPGG